jgi:hypothetical protein
MGFVVRLVVDTIGGAANAAQKLRLLESCCEISVSAGIGLAGRGSRGLTVHTLHDVNIAQAIVNIK